MNERQLKSLVRQTFILQGQADRMVLKIDDTLAAVMVRVRSIIELLPAEGLLRDKTWKEIRPFVQVELQKYRVALGQSLLSGLSMDAQQHIAYAVRQANYAGGNIDLETVQLGVGGSIPYAASVQRIVKTKVNDKRLKELFGLDRPLDEIDPIDRVLMRTVEKRVKLGIIRGETTQDIADGMASMSMVMGREGVKLTADSARQIRRQAFAMARTAVQDSQRQVIEAVYQDNPEATGDLVWEWSTSMDSRVCPTCQPLDGKTWKQNEPSPDWPLHVACRCQKLLIDPTDPWYQENSRTVQVIRPKSKGQYAGAAASKTPVEIKGQKYYRRAVAIDSDTPPPKYSDALAYWANNSTTSLEVAMGKKRARIFKDQLNRLNKDPDQILQSLLQGDPGTQKWIPLSRLNLK